MNNPERRRFLKLAAGGAALSVLPPTIRRALAVQAKCRTGTIKDVKHVVILMLENRSFDHYFGTLRGVRGFGDRHPLPLASGKPVWWQSDGNKEVPPYHLNSKTTSAFRVPGTPHTFSDAQAAWNQGKFGFWPKFKTSFSMGHYRREDISFQFALAEAFTICDAHHCSVTTGTDPNRIVFFSGSNFDPVQRSRGRNCTSTEAEVNNLRCLIKGSMPSPGYTYEGTAFAWPTIPDLLEQAGISWRIYQDPNDNWMGLMHGGLAFASFREALPGSALYEKGLSNHSLEELAQDVVAGALPQVSWVLPPKLWSEHPVPSSPPQGAEFTMKLLDALVTNPEVWSRTALFLSFDENDGFFDHIPPPAPPSFELDGTPAGKATLSLAGHYFLDASRDTIDPADTVSGAIRPFGLGPRVPLTVISPWTRGGWVNSQVFDHTSLGQFLEKRFDITVPSISPWHRAVCGDLTSAFDFVTPNEDPFPVLPATPESTALIATIVGRPPPSPPKLPAPLFQEPGMRRSRALPYDLHVDARVTRDACGVLLAFINAGNAGAVFHVYDRLALHRIPRRYTVEAGKSLSDEWPIRGSDGCYDLWAYGPNGFVREFRGWALGARRSPEVAARYDVLNRALRIIATSAERTAAKLTVRANEYRGDGPWVLQVTGGQRAVRDWSLVSSHNWYDFSVFGPGLERRFAGRVETGEMSYSDPAV
jgi:phospholipase C